MPDETSPQKRCSKCHEIKPLEMFSKQSRSKDGRKTQCKACVAAYYAANSEAIRAAVQNYRLSHPEIIRERKRAYYEANTEKISEWKRAHYAAHREEILAKQKIYYETNAERIRKRVRLYCEAIPEIIRERKRAYQVAHPEMSRMAWHRRRARIKGNGGSFSLEERQAMEIAQKGLCAYCGRAAPLTIDHIIPLDQGGRHEAPNICLACATCNNSKHNRTPEEWVNRWYLRPTSDES